jgi:hypothetical protein
MIVEAIDREQLPALSQGETAKVMTMRGYPMSRARVQRIEQRALRKLAAIPEIAALLPEVLAESGAQLKGSC